MDEEGDARNGKMKHNYIYIGCFVSLNILFARLADFSNNRLPKIIKNPHITFSYMPHAVNEALFGEDVRLTVTGYGNDGENEGVSVVMQSENTELAEMIKRIEVPHITVSVSETGRPVNTRRLLFRPIEPFEMAAEFGGYSKFGRIELKAPLI